MPRKPASENVVYLCRLLNILANFSNLFLHTEEQSDQGPHCLQKRLLKSQADDKADDNCCYCQFKGKGLCDYHIQNPGEGYSQLHYSCHCDIRVPYKEGMPANFLTLSVSFTIFPSFFFTSAK